MIPAAAIAELAEVFDRFNNAFDPTRREARDAEQQFDAKVEALHATHAADVGFATFRFELIRQCRQYLAKN